MRVGLVLALFAAAGAAGCLDGDGPVREPPCREPDPCMLAAPVWPTGLDGPFGLLRVETLRVAADDGTELAGGLWLPDLPDGLRAPTVLWQSPYFGACVVHNGPATTVPPEGPASYQPFPCQPPADSMDLYDQYGRIHIRTLVEAGFAVAAMNVRGTGGSHGCADPFGPRESDDSALLVEILAAMPWSNGRVAMVGHSYSGGTPWGAAIRAPPALKAIVASGIVTDLYTFYHTPQGLASDVHASALATLTLENTLPTNPQSGDQVTWPAVERACPEYATRPAVDTLERAELPRDAAFWEAHRYVTGFAGITAAVLVVHGYTESCPFGHCQQDDAIWDLIQAPKRFILGQWGHDLPPPPDRLEGAPFGPDWYRDTMVPWLDFWLKGIGPPQDLGVVDWQDDRLAWHRSGTPSAAAEVLYLTDTGLAPTPASSSRQMLSSAGLDACLTDVGVLVYSVTVEEPVLLHGSPALLLTVSSSMPRGLVHARLVVSNGPIGCGVPYVEHGGGGVDLRYHAGGYAPAPFPVGAPTHVRVDLGSVAVSLQPGQVLSIGLSSGADAPSAEGAAVLTVTGDGTTAGSQVALPVASGTLGGAPPAVTYPRRPFAPDPGPFSFEG